MNNGPILIVGDEVADLAWASAGAMVLSADDYLADGDYAKAADAKVINLCHYERYQSPGYYVSLLAEARGQAALPAMKTVGDLQDGHMGTLASAAFLEELQPLLADCRDDEFAITVAFGRALSGGSDALASKVFEALPAPLLQVQFTKSDRRWHTSDVRVLCPSDLGPDRQTRVGEALMQYLRGAGCRRRDSRAHLPSLAILYDPDEPDPPSNTEALRRFLETARELGLRSEVIGRSDLSRLPEFDGLFIRDTTRVNHYTYQFARTAAEGGLVVIDDPESILRCTNKVFLHEVLCLNNVLTPKTMMVRRDNAAGVASQLGLPCVLKQPDSAFSLGVFKVETEAALSEALNRLLARSDIVLAQQWLPTRFDWRVGVIDRRPLYVCKYFMAPGHWQVIKREAQRTLEGSTVTMTVGEAPACVVETALRAANLVGDGLYGVDIKEAAGKCYVMEVNDNPNIDAGNEDAVLKDALYREIVGVFLRRIRSRERVADS